MPIDASRAAGRTTHLPRPAISSEPLRLHPVAQAVSGAICALMLYMALPQAASAQSSVAPAAQTGLLRFDIPAGPLAAALRSLASTANLLLTFTEEQTRGKATAGIEGQYTSQEALAAVLAGTGLQAVALDGGGYVLRAVPAGLVGEATPREGVPATLAPVRVTGRAERPSDLPEAYAGGQVARGARLGLLGNTDIMDAPFGIASYTARTIENQQLQGRSVADLVSRNDPSVRVYGGDGADTDTLRIRGFNVAIADAAFDGLPGLLSYQRSGTEFAERVEVLRGPNAMLNGMAPGGSVGGALNVVPKRAGDVPLTRLTASYLSDSRFGLHADLGRRFGTDNEWGIRINGALGKGETARDSQDQKHALGSIALDYRSQRLRASIDYVNQNLRDTGNSTPLLYVGTIGVVPAPPDGSTNLSQPWSEVRNGNRMLNSSVEYDITPDLTVHAKLG
ncbi:MAG: TonB-dependent receptor plug domain-containing protein [Lautropia sp.]